VGQFIAHYNDDRIHDALNDYRLKPVGSDTTESRGTRLKPSEAFPAQSRLKARWARLS
jgi:hypothetical protein